MILELRDICKTYLQGKFEVPVLNNVSLSVEEGEYLAIMGPSGSGKTTLMNIIGCLDVPTSGQYILEGEDLSGKSDAMLSQTRLRSIGFVFQSFYLLSRQSAVENVALPLLYAGVKRKERTEKARRALERVGLGDRVDFKPTQLSGGQCQRVAIARAMVNEPRLLLADEPTGALDTASGEQIMELFEKLHREGVTIVMITHEPSIAAHAQRVLHIRDGRLVDAPLPAPALSAAPAENVSPTAAPAKAPVVIEGLITKPAPEDAGFAEEPVLDEPTPEEIAAFADEDFVPAPETPAAEAPEGPEAPERPEQEQQPEPAPALDIEDIPSPLESEPQPEALSQEPLRLAEPVAVKRQPPRLTPIELDGLFRRPEPAKTEEPPEPAEPVPSTETAPEEPVFEIEEIVIEEAPEEPQTLDAFARQLRELSQVSQPSAPAEPEADLEEPVQPVVPEEPMEVPAEPEPSEPVELPAAELDEAALGAEVAALLDHGQATADAYASGDMFLHDATAKAPELIARPTKIGAPDQLSFDVWVEPEELDVEAEAAASAIALEEPEPDPQAAEEPQLVLEPTAPAEEALPDEPAGPQAERIDMDFDTAFDAVDPYEPQEAPAPSGAFGAPMPTDIDLGSAFARREPAEPTPPWGAPGPSDKPRLVEIENLAPGKTSPGGDAS